MKYKVNWGPGFRLFKCENCEHTWKEASRHCESMSVGDMCPECDSDDDHLIGFERHYEWETDEFCNLIEGKEYV